MIYKIKSLFKADEGITLKEYSAILRKIKLHPPLQYFWWNDTMSVQEKVIRLSKWDDEQKRLNYLKEEIANQTATLEQEKEWYRKRLDYLNNKAYKKPWQPI